MGKKFVIEGAMCTCMFGATPAKLIVLDQKFAHINGPKLIATDKNLGNVFMPPAFGICNKSWPPKPCTPMLKEWNGAYEKIKINRIAQPLLEDSKGTCAIGGNNCIQFIMDGQIEMPGSMQMKKASSEFQGELDPIGESLALNENQIFGIKEVKVK